MRFGFVFSALTALAFLFASAAAGPVHMVAPKEQPLDLSVGGWDQISDTDHTAEYLAKTGGIPQAGYDASAPKVSGPWLFELRDSNMRPAGEIDLNLYQAGALIWGMGNLTSGLASQPVTAQGSISEGSMYLGIVSLGEMNLYRISISSPNAASVSGSFDAFTTAGARTAGSVSGSRNEPRTFTPFDVPIMNSQTGTSSA